MRGERRARLNLEPTIVFHFSVDLGVAGGAGGGGGAARMAGKEWRRARRGLRRRRRRRQKIEFERRGNGSRRVASRREGLRP